MRAEISDRQVGELAALGMDYWWFAVRLRHVQAILRAHLPSGPVRYLDLGCGAGRTMEAVLAALRPREAVGLDGTDGALAEASARGLPVHYADFRLPFALPFRPNVITALDVLEHIEDDVGALQRLADAAAPGALLVATVPALPSLTSRWDEVCGHHRRYRRPVLREHLRRGGWRPLRLRYFFSYCVPPAWVERRVLGRVQEFEFPRVHPALNKLLSVLGRLECALGSPAPFGTSLVATAVRAEPAG